MPLSSAGFSLDRNYFQVIHEQEGTHCNYQVVRPLGSPMILFSTSDPRGPIPLASIHFEAQEYNRQKNSNGTRAQTLITQRWRQSPMACDFQGIITQDNQDYQFVITNLTTGNDILNINLLKKDVKVTEKDPGVHGSGLNQVNELKPGQSYQVQCDQKDNRSLILCAIKDEKGQHVSVKQDEVAGPREAKGTYYYPSVIGPKNSAMQALFKETVWSTVDYFILMVKKPQMRVPRSRMHIQQESSEVLLDSAVNHRRHSRPVERVFRSTNINIDSDDGEEEECDDDFSMENESMLQSMSLSPPMAIVREKAVKKSASRQSNFHEESCEVLATPHQPLQNLIHNDEDMVEQSHAVKVASGRQISVFSGQTDVIYDFDLPSKHCVLGLSLSDKVVFYGEPDTRGLVEEAKNSITDYENSQGQFFLQKLTTIYKDDQPCCICLEAEPNMVMYQCGHQCCCATCLQTSITKCPLCRTSVSAQIRVR
jgi:hypothetical protein